MRIRLVDSTGTEIDALTVRRPFHLPSRDVVVLERRPDELTVRLRDRGGAFSLLDDGTIGGDVVVGRLPVLHSDGAGLLLVEYLTVPPPAPLGPDGVDQMWERVRLLPGSVPASVRRDTTASIGQSVTGALDPRLDLLPRLHVTLQALAHRWPQQEAIETGWRPVDLAGGREDVRTTLQRPLRAGVLMRPGSSATVAESARSRRAMTGWRIGAVADVLVFVRRTVRDLGWDGDSGPLDRLLAAAITECDPGPMRGKDPSPSSWPPAIRALHDLGLDFLVGAAAAKDPTVSAPLCHLWELYESWVAFEVMSAVSLSLGHGPSEVSLVGKNTKGGEMWRASWSAGDVAIRLWCQPEIRWGSTASPEMPPLRSCTADLIPDLLLMAQRTPGTARYAVLDAKFHGESRMTAGTVAEAASKYLWGVRSTESSDECVLDEVILVGSGPAGMMNSSASATSTAMAFPGHTDGLAETVSSLVDRLMAA